MKATQGKRMSTKIFVVSLPRTGTMSMSQMLIDLGYKTTHAPGPAFLGGYLDRYDAFTDTPVYRPSLVKEMLNRYPNAKFIYIEKEQEAWFRSMDKVGLVSTYNNDLQAERQKLSRFQICDLDAMAEVLKGQTFDMTSGVLSFLEHRQEVEMNIPQDQLLMYKFSQGWEPLCKFLGKEIPEKEVPHLNQNTMFDKLTEG
jgi:hypothetical protein